MKISDISSRRMAYAIRAKRRDKGLTQKKLGEMTGLSITPISWMESGKAKSVGEAGVRRVLSFLEIDPSKFIPEKEELPAPDVTKESSVSHEIPTLEPEGKRSTEEYQEKQEPPKEESHKKSLDEKGHVYLRECMEKRIPLLMGCHKDGWKTGVISDMTAYDIRFYDFNAKAGERFKKLRIKYFFVAKEGVSIKEFFRIDKLVREKNIEPTKAITERYQISDELLKEALEERLRVKLTSNEGEVFEGLILWFDKFHIYLKLMPDIFILFFRHGVCDFRIRQSGSRWVKPNTEERRECVKKVRLSDDDSKKLAGAIRAKRKEMGLSQEKLGEKLGISSTSMGRLEQGVTNKLKEEKIWEILVFLGIDAAGFIPENDRPPATDVIEKKTDAQGKSVEKSAIEHEEQSILQEAVKKPGAPEEEGKKESSMVARKIPGEILERIEEYKREMALRESVDAKKLADAVRAKRLEMGMSQKKLGEQLGISSGSIGWLELGAVKKLKEHRIREILAFLGIDATRFMRDEEEPPVADVVEEKSDAYEEAEKESPPEPEDLRALHGAAEYVMKTNKFLKEKTKGLTAREFAMKVGISRDYAKKLLSPTLHMLPSDETGRRIVKGLKLSRTDEEEFWKIIAEDRRALYGAGKRKGLNVRVSLRFPGEIHDKVKEYGRKKGLAGSEVVREVIEKFFAEPGLPEEVPAVPGTPGDTVAVLPIPQAPAAPVELSTKEQEKSEVERKKKESVRQVTPDEDEEEPGKEDEEVAMCEEIEMLRKAGYTYEAIAELMGLDAEKVRQVVQREKIRKNELEKKEFVRRELKNLDVMQNALWEKAASGSNAAVELVIKIMQHRAKLSGWG